MRSKKTLISCFSACFCLAFLVFQSCRKSAQISEQDVNEWYSGGKQTSFNSGSSAFGQMFNGLSASKDRLHSLGDISFNAVFNSDLTQLDHGLGPIYNNQSCGSCHIADGRGKSPNAGDALVSLLIRISIPGEGPHGGPNPVPGFGAQLQQRGIFGVQPEADVEVSYTENSYQFPDGEAYSLRTPKFTIVNPYTSMPAGVMLSPRMASPVCGLGLLESIDEASILARADENDANGDGISGRPNYGFDEMAQAVKLGRFGWKAAQPSIIQQSAAAYVEDMGITNMIFKSESSTGEPQFPAGERGYELGDSTLYATAYYIKSLAVPGRRNADDATVKSGKNMFNTVGCAKCHNATYTTGANMIFPELSSQIIYPYSDLLLHDMGTGLADNRPDFRASGTEWRTPPLWGIGLTTIVNGHNNFLHDGRARNLTEAIMWHDGEAATARNGFKNLAKSDRDALIAFLNSL